MGALTISAKYLIELGFEVQGTVDKPDIIGALFSQTEGLLGSDLDLRELQNTSRIGRIEVEVEHRGDKTVGKVYVPSNLDHYETALIAAMLETVDRVGPYNAKFQVNSIKDLRSEKRKLIIDRAKELIKLIERETIPDTKELMDKFLGEVKQGEVVSYGPEGLPAGPDVESSDTVIIVEGRADVVNLIKHGYRNVIAIEGASGGIPKTVIELSRRKTTIAFTDGDRGGEMILRELLKVADIDYIARAPPGKEVEQLTAKEIAKALRNKIPVEEYINQLSKKDRQIIEESKKQIEQAQVQPSAAPTSPQPQPESTQPTQPIQQVQVTQQTQVIEVPAQTQGQVQVTTMQQSTQQTPQLPTSVVDEINKLSGTLEAIIYDKNWTVLKRVPVRDLLDTLQQVNDAYAIVFDGVGTQRLVDAAVGKGIKMLIMTRIGNIAKVPSDMVILTFNDIINK
ncbi:DNA primase DnaG [Caldivirga maquilingensis]|uniref:DNA primase DnaG n=1 Tax=Caldivirga maquilingensis (strain ATCC 700844 / DSM 13496 / JCM 10307 / IC-167) TaxID=397948 RepID=DNAG_CALMQ|nr:DNA primase DnaG [Caldivirga maquilingensis]A8MA86.1 RecName: Full=DNA primase DnaG [Caldivirga maquilingensis IC-167]ABW01018.1 TOPRIM domain protein [Caldivirga maquilingensis IC-167]